MTTSPITAGMSPDALQAQMAEAEALLAARTPNKTLGQEEFLKLLTTQFSQQDPMEPVKDTEFIAQMAQFTSLEQMNALTQSFSYNSASSLIGREVTVKTGAQDADQISGVVDAVHFGDKGAELLIGENRYSMNDVVTVRPAPAQPQQTVTEE